MPQDEETMAKGLLGKLCSGEKKLEAKIFYLHDLKKQTAALLEEAINFQGGKVESFLHKDISFVVTGNREFLNDIKKESEETRSPTEQGAHGLRKNMQRSGHSKPKVPLNASAQACVSRGKALLEKAIRNNNERLQVNSVLANAKAWGVKILFVDAVIFYLKHLNMKTLSTKLKKTRNPVVKAIALRVPSIKIEDVSRRYKPLHVQAMNIPVLHYSGRFSPFESPPSVSVRQAEKDKVKKRSKAESGPTAEESHSPLSPSPWRCRKKDLSFCECCHQPFSNLEEHLQSDQHRAFVQDSSNYILVDQLVSVMLPGFSPISQQLAIDRPSTPLSCPYTDDLLFLTDAEVEDAVQQQHAHVNSAPSSPKKMTVCGSPAVLSGPYPIPDVETPPARSSLQPPGTLCALDVSSQVINKINSEFNHHDPESQRTPPQDPCQQILIPPFDPYSQPPVLSPQVPKSDEAFEPHSLYSEPPVLSPQCYLADEEQSVCEVDANFESFMAVETFNLEAPLRPNLDFWPSNSSVMTSKKRHMSSPKPSRRKRRKPMRSSSGSMTDSVEDVESRECQLNIASKRHYEQSIDPECTGETFCDDRVAQICSEKKEQVNVPRHCNVQPSWLGSYIQLFHEPVSVQATKPSQCESPSFLPLIPEMSKLAPSSDSDWDCDLLSQSSAALASRHLHLQNYEVDRDVLRQPCTWMHGSTYESRLHTVLQPAKSAATLFQQDVDQNVFSRSVVHILEVTH